MKVVINKCYGGFSLSREAMEEYCRRKGWEIESEPMWPGGNSKSRHYFRVDVEPRKLLSNSNIIRSDPDLISVVVEMQERANGDCAKLEIIEIPDDVEWEVGEYDGQEWIAEKHRIWS